MEVIKMPTVKEETIKMISSLPDEVDYDEIMAEIYFRKRVDKSLKQIDEGKTITHAEAVKRLSKWIK
jgi:predicted transcriptional regulator